MSTLFLVKDCCKISQPNKMVYISLYVIISVLLSLFKTNVNFLFLNKVYTTYGKTATNSPWSFQNGPPDFWRKITFINIQFVSFHPSSIVWNRLT